MDRWKWQLLDDDPLYFFQVAHKYDGAKTVNIIYQFWDPKDTGLSISFVFMHLFVNNCASLSNEIKLILYLNWKCTFEANIWRIVFTMTPCLLETSYMYLYYWRLCDKDIMFISQILNLFQTNQVISTNKPIFFNTCSFFMIQIYLFIFPQMKTKVLPEKLYFTCQCIFHKIDINFSVQTIHILYIVFWSKQKYYDTTTSIAITHFSDSTCS